MVTLATTHGPLSAQYGLHVNEFRREHTRDVVLGADAGTRDYFNYGTKGEANASPSTPGTSGAPISSAT